MDIKKAYTLGFLLGDSHLKDNGVITCTVSLKDKKILEDISLIFKNSTVSYFHKTDRDKKIFPSCRIYIPKRDFPEAKMLFSGNLKVDRHIPIISPEFERYLLLGFFDAEGCITWGVRKDRDRLWQKVQLSSQYRMLIGIQNILLKYDISSSIAPVRNSNHYVISISNQLRVLKIMSIYLQINQLLLYLKK
jgi:intein/homing endonuclease